MGRRLYWWVGGVGVLLAAFALYWVRTAPSTVETIRVQKREVVELYVATGEIDARREADVGVEVPGTVVRVAVEEGDRVERGDVLVELRPTDAKLAVDRAEARVETVRNEFDELKRGPTDAELRTARAEVDRVRASVAQAEREFERMRSLHRQGVATNQQLERAQTTLQEAEARLAQAKARLSRLEEQPLRERVQAARARLAQAKVDLERARQDAAKTTLRAPFDGRVLSVPADEGERLGGEATVARIADMSTAEVYAEVDEDYFSRIEVGERATLILPSMPDETFEATVRQVGPEVSADRGVVGVHLEPKRLPDGLFPGLTVDANIEVERLEETLAVPAEAVVRDSAAAYVLTVERGRAIRNRVELLVRGERWTAIDGLEPGTRVLRRASTIEPGTSIRPVPGGGS